LALIADESVHIDETLGDVIRFKPIPGIPTSYHAQIIRLLLPAIFENDVCLISDIDMVPLNKNYFTDQIKNLPDDSFVVFQNGYFEKYQYHFQYPMCYNASLGKNFKEIFHVKNLNQIEDLIKKWYRLNIGWSTDQIILFKYLAIWKDFKNKCILLGLHDDRRVDKLNWSFDPNLVKQEFYTDAHMPRPYEKFKEQIDYLVNLLPFKEKNENK